MSPFTPKGDKARWKIIYPLLAKVSVGDVFTYEAIGTALDLDPEADRHTIQMAMRRAAKELEVENKHALESVPNVGYRVVEPAEHLALAKRHQRRAGKSLARGQSKVVNVDLRGLDPEIRGAFQVVAQAFALQMDMNRRFDGRTKKIEAAMSEIVGKQERTEAEIAELRDRLERIEKSEN